MQPEVSKILSNLKELLEEITNVQEANIKVFYEPDSKTIQFSLKTKLK